jgi:hypothetical protein
MWYYFCNEFNILPTQSQTYLLSSQGSVIYIVSDKTSKSGTGYEKWAASTHCMNNVTAIQKRHSNAFFFLTEKKVHLIKLFLIA